MNDGDVQPATSGTYGEAPPGFRLPDSTTVGPVRLQVTDLTRSLPYYEDILGLRVIAREAGHAALAAQGGDRILVHLVEVPGEQPAGGQGPLGLYHYAILLPDRASLARFVRHLADHDVAAGAGDHLVSEAFYLRDPDGLGIEVYADRPRDTWRRRGRELQMATDPVDVSDLLIAAGESRWTGMPAGTVMGHVHLHVGDLARAAAFYAEGLGFDRTTWSYPGALFLGAGGYHHHVAVNTWAGAVATAAPGEARLLEWTLELPDAANVLEMHANLTAGGHASELMGDGTLVARDPWGTQVRVNAGVRAQLSLS
jgi:catechol 2,3-dioxygenase